MPDNFTDDLAKIHFDHHISFAVICLKDPLNILFFLIACLRIQLILFLPLQHAIFSLLILFLAVECCLHNKNKLFIDNSQETIGLTWAPFNAVDDGIGELVLSEDS